MSAYPTTTTDTAKPREDVSPMATRAEHNREKQQQHEAHALMNGVLAYQTARGEGADRPAAFEALQATYERLIA